MNRIRDLRLQKGWRQEDLAQRLNTKRQTVARYETEKLGIDAGTICALCDIFGCTADYLLGRSVLPAADLTEDEAALLLAFRAADAHIRDGIRALLKPYAEEAAGAVS
jgi:transcriptional regulator with XRE-family HTH domain